MITVNVISTFLLAMLLLPKLKATSRAYTTEVNLTIVSSEVHSFAKFPERNAANIFEELDDEKKFNQGDRYPVSKLLEVRVTPRPLYTVTTGPRPNFLTAAFLYLPCGMLIYF